MEKNTRLLLSAAVLLGAGFASGYLTRSRTRMSAPDRPERSHGYSAVPSDFDPFDLAVPAEWKMNESELFTSLSHLPH